MQLKGVRVQAEADRDEVNTALTETQVEIDRVVQDNTTVRYDSFISKRNFLGKNNS